MKEEDKKKVNEILYDVLGLTPLPSEGYVLDEDKNYLPYILNDFYHGDWEYLIHDILHNMSPDQFDKIKFIYRQFHHDPHDN